MAKTQILGFSRARMPVAMGVTKPIFGAVTYVWGLNIRGKFHGRSSRPSYFCQVRACWHYGVSAHAWGGPLPQLDRCAQNFCGVTDYVIQSTNVESFAFLALLVFEI